MTAEAYAAIRSLRDEFRSLVEDWTATHPYLANLQERLRAELGYDDYRVETPIVYNRALDEIGPDDEIRIVLVADNPGKNEQLARNNRYLVGQSGRLAEGWFRRELGLEFRRDVLILNKTPVHTPKTAELRKLLALAGGNRGRLERLLAESQVAMAGLALKMHVALNGQGGGGGSDRWTGGKRAARDSASGNGNPPTDSHPLLWISGLGEFRKGGLFTPYGAELTRLYSPTSTAGSLRGSVLAFNHFSMNQFAIEVKRKADPEKDIRANLALIGSANRKRVFGF